MRTLCYRLTCMGLLLISTAAATAQINPAVVPAVKMDRDDPTKPNKGFIDRHESFVQRIQQGNVDLLLIGDSITHLWEPDGAEVWARYYTHRNAVNLGIGGDRTQHVLWRLMNGELEGIAPKAAVVMIGTNNSGSESSEQIAEGVAAICKLLRTKLPKTKILLLAIFPRGADNNDPKRMVNEGANRIIKKMNDGQWIHYLDINAAFLEKDGTLSKEIMPDLLHPNAKGYQIWAEAMEPALAKLMGDKPVK